MSNPKNDAKPTGCTEAGAVELTEDEVRRVVGGAKFDGIDGESNDAFYRPSPTGAGTTEEMVTGKRQHKPL